VIRVDRDGEHLAEYGPWAMLGERAPHFPIAPGGLRGAAAIDYAIGLGRRAGARHVLLAHHKPGRTDNALDEVARRVAAAPGNVTVAAEGEIIDL
jgi:hypothetical protein